MPYTILNNNGSLLVRVADDTIDQSTSVTFVGKDYSGYGQYYNQNLVTLLTNSANANYAPPKNPQQGQLWYDTTFKRLRIYDSSWGSAGGATVSDTQPAGLSAGDFWYDSTYNVLNFFNGTQYSTVQTYKLSQPTGWITPTSAILDNNNPPVNQQVTLLDNYGTVVGALSQSTFTASVNDSENTFASSNTSTYEIYQGLNILGSLGVTNGIQYTGNTPIYSTSTAQYIGQMVWAPEAIPGDSAFIYISVNTASNITQVGGQWIKNWVRITLSDF